jgi:hypothetical protein
MTYSVSRPEILTIAEEESGRSFFGGDQEWYLD